MMQKATMRTRTVGKSSFNPELNKRVPGDSNETAVIRSAWCGKKYEDSIAHHPISSDFRGVNEKGWIFFCKEGCNLFLAEPADG